MSSARRDFFCVAALAAIVLVTNLGGTKLWDEDEPRNARCAVEMFERGDLVVPTFNGELRTHKPILLYWLMLAAYQVLGISEFTARLPSALLGIGTVLCVWASGRRLFGRRSALFAAAAMSSALMFDVAARAATPDSVLIFWMTAAVTVFIHAVFDRDGQMRRLESDGSPVWFPRTARTLIGFYACLGVAILAKGPVGFVLPMAVTGMFLLIVRRSHSAREADASAVPGWRIALSWFAPKHFLSTLRCMNPIVGALIALAIATPWYWAVGAATDGEWLRGFFLEHNLGRATRAMESHSGPFLIYYIIAVMVGFFPWSVFLLPSLLDTRRRFLADRSLPPGIALAACWIAVPVVLFSFASTKLPSYVTPGYPGLALLVGTFLDRVASSRSALSINWLRASFGSSVVVGIALAIGAGVGMSLMFPGEYLLLLPGIVLAIGAAVSLVRFNRGANFAALQAYGVTGVAFVICLFQVAAPQVSKHQEIQVLFETPAASGADFATFEVMQSSWVYYSGQTLERFGRDDIDSLREFLTTTPDRFVVTKVSQTAELSDLVGLRLVPVEQTPWFLKDDSHELALLKPEPATSIAGREKPAAKLTLISHEEPQVSVK